MSDKADRNPMPVERLATELQRGLRNTITNGYTILTPVARNNSVTMRVKDSRSAKMLTVTISEDQ